MTVGIDLATIVRYVVQYSLTFFLIAWLIQRMTKGASKPANTVVNTDTKQLKMPRALKWVGWLDIFFFTACIVLSSIFPGKTQNLSLVQAVFAVFVLLGVYLVYTARLVVQWNAERLDTYNLWGTKPITFRWDAVRCITYHPNLMMFSFELVNSAGKGWVPAAYYEGLVSFYEDLLLHCRHLPLVNLTWDELEAYTKQEADWDNDSSPPKEHEEEEV